MYTLTQLRARIGLGYVGCPLRRVIWDNQLNKNPMLSLRKKGRVNGCGLAIKYLIKIKKLRFKYIKLYR